MTFFFSIFACRLSSGNLTVDQRLVIIIPISEIKEQVQRESQPPMASVGSTEQPMRVLKPEAHVPGTHTSISSAAHKATCLHKDGTEIPSAFLVQEQFL